MSDDELFRQYAHEVLLRHRAKRKAASRERRSVAGSATGPFLRDTTSSGVGGTPVLAQRHTNEQGHKGDLSTQDVDTNSSSNTDAPRRRKRRRVRASPEHKLFHRNRGPRDPSSAVSLSARSTPTIVRALPKRTYGRKSLGGNSADVRKEGDVSKRNSLFSWKDMCGKAKQDEGEDETRKGSDDSDDGDDGDDGDVHHCEIRDDNEDAGREVDYYGPELTEDGRDCHMLYEDGYLERVDDITDHAPSWDHLFKQYSRYNERDDNSERQQGRRRGPRRSCRESGQSARARSERLDEHDGEGEENSEDGSSMDTEDDEDDEPEQGEDNTSDNDYDFEGASLEDARNEMDFPDTTFDVIPNGALNIENGAGFGGGTDEGDSVEKLLLGTVDEMDLPELGESNNLPADDTTGATNNASVPTATVVGAALRALDLPEEVLESDAFPGAPLGIRNALNATTKVDVQFSDTHKGILHRLLRPRSAPGELRRMWPALRPIVWDRVKALKRLSRPANSPNVAAFNRLGPQLYGHSPPVQRATPCSACTRAKSACYSLAGQHECARCLLSRAPCVEKRPAPEGNV